MATVYYSRGYVASRRLRRVAAITGCGLALAAVAWLVGVLGPGATTPNVSVLRSVAIQWPTQGQAAIAVGGLGHRSSVGAHRPAPIASLAKIMTAYVVLQHDPVGANESGFTLTMTATDVANTTIAAGQGQSVIPVQPGEQLTELQALQALLLPSANNIAAALAVRVAGSTGAFLQQMNDSARSLGMRHTVYTDPSGLDAGTVSTAGDQLRLARAAMDNQTIADIVRLQHTLLPVAGTVANTDTLLGHDGFVGIKTGSDDAAGGCFMFESVRRVHHRPTRIFGVVLGQHDGPLIAAALGSARQLVDNVVGQLRSKGAAR